MNSVWRDKTQGLGLFAVWAIILFALSISSLTFRVNLTTTTLLGTVSSATELVSAPLVGFFLLRKCHRLRYGLLATFLVFWAFFWVTLAVLWLDWVWSETQGARTLSVPVGQLVINAVGFAVIPAFVSAFVVSVAYVGIRKALTKKR